MRHMKFRKNRMDVDATRWFKHGDHPAVEGNDPHEGYIRHLLGFHRVTPGDWIITEADGVCWPCHPEVFEYAYEPVPTDDALTVYTQFLDVLYCARNITARQDMIDQWFHVVDQWGASPGADTDSDDPRKRDAEREHLLRAFLRSLEQHGQE